MEKEHITLQKHEEEIKKKKIEGKIKVIIQLN